MIFHQEDSFVISTGGGDNCVFLWQTDYVAGDKIIDERHGGASSGGTRGGTKGGTSGGASGDHDISDMLDDLIANAPSGGGDQFMASKPWLGK